MLEAAAKLDRPIIIQFSEGGAAFFAGGGRALCTRAVGGGLMMISVPLTPTYKCTPNIHLTLPLPPPARC